MRNISIQRHDSGLRSVARASAWAAVLAGVVACSDSDSDEPATPSPLELQAREILDAHQARQEFPGAVLALHDPRQGDAVVKSGVSQPGPQSSPVTPEVPWAIGSATKMFVAVVVLQLAEQGELALDASIEPYFPDLPRSSEITPRELLQHTSGLAEYLDSPAVSSDAQRPWSAQELVDIAVARGPVAEPGSAHHYANTNYILLGELIAQLSGHPWYEEVRRRILEPLGMQHTHYAGEPLAPPLGAGYTIENGQFVEATSRVHASVGGAAGALQSTAPDLLRFARALLLGSLLDEQSQAEMRAFVPGEPRGYVGHEYGLGFEKYVVNQVTLYGHAGSAPAHGSFVGFEAQSGLALAVMVNSDDPAAAPLMALEFVGAATGQDVSPPPGASALPSE